MEIKQFRVGQEVNYVPINRGGRWARAEIKMIGPQLKIPGLSRERQQYWDPFLVALLGPIESVGPAGTEVIAFRCEFRSLQ